MNIDSIPYLTGIYNILHRPTLKLYVGSSKDLPKRSQDHLKALQSKTHGNILLQTLWNLELENGGSEDNFSFVCLEPVYPATRLREREQFFIDKYLPTGRLLNINLSSSKIKVLSMERRISEIARLTKIMGCQQLLEQERLRAEIETSKVEKLSPRQEAKIKDAENKMWGWEVLVSYEDLLKQKPLCKSEFAG